MALNIDADKHKEMVLEGEKDRYVRSMKMESNWSMFLSLSIWDMYWMNYVQRKHNIERE